MEYPPMCGESHRKPHVETMVKDLSVDSLFHPTQPIPSRDTHWLIE
jgi:hypothetical protein